MCPQLSLLLDAASRDRNSPSPEPGCFCCFSHITLSGMVFSQGCDASLSPRRITFLSCNICHLASKHHKRLSGKVFVLIALYAFPEKSRLIFSKTATAGEKCARYGSCCPLHAQLLRASLFWLLEGCCLSLVSPFVLLLDFPSFHLLCFL